MKALAKLQQHGPLVALTGGRILHAVAGLVALRLLTEFLSTEEVGRYNLILAVGQAVQLILLAPVETYFVRHTVEWWVEGRLRAQMWSLISYVAGSLAIVGAALFFFRGVVEDILALNALIVFALVAGQANLNSIQQQLSIALHSLGRIGQMVVLTILREYSAIGMAILLTTTLAAATATWWIGGLIAGYAALVPLCLWLFLRASRNPAPTAPETPAPAFYSLANLRFGAPLLVGLIFYWVQVSGYRFGLEANADETSVGIFVASFAAGWAPMILFDRIFYDYLAPPFYREVAHASVERKVEAWTRLVTLYWPLVIVAGAILAAGAPFAVRILVAETYWPYAWIASFAALTQVFVIMCSSFNFFVRQISRTQLMVPSTVVGGLWAGAATYIASAHAPLLGTSIALFTATAAGFVTACVCLRRYIRLPVAPIFRSVAAGIVCVLPVIGMLLVWPTPGIAETAGGLVLCCALWAAAALVLTRLNGAQMPSYARQ